jgi:hypothetical protein
MTSSGEGVDATGALEAGNGDYLGAKVPVMYEPECSPETTSYVYQDQGSFWLLCQAICWGGEVAGASGRGLEGRWRCSRMARAVAERRTQATRRLWPPQRGQVRTSVRNVLFKSSAHETRDEEGGLGAVEDAALGRQRRGGRGGGVPGTTWRLHLALGAKTPK